MAYGCLPGGMGKILAWMNVRPTMNGWAWSPSGVGRGEARDHWIPEASSPICLAAAWDTGSVPSFAGPPDMPAKLTQAEGVLLNRVGQN